MEDFFPAIMLGFLLGLKHAVEVDHVVAVSTIVSQNKSLLKASLAGTFWGVGHTLTLLLVGIGVIAFRLTIPNRLAVSMEFLVGVVLVGLGLFTIRDFFKRRVHVHTHDHQNESHLHFHSHEFSALHLHEHRPNHRVKPLLVGMAHGLAGSAALMLLVLTTIRSPVQGLLYILVFGLGSIGGMLLLSAAISLPFVLSADRFRRFNETIKVLAGVTSIILGVFVMAEIGLH